MLHIRGTDLIGALREIANSLESLPPSEDHCTVALVGSDCTARYALMSAELGGEVAGPLVEIIQGRFAESLRSVPRHDEKTGFLRTALPSSVR